MLVIVIVSVSVSVSLGHRMQGTAKQCSGKIPFCSLLRERVARWASDHEVQSHPIILNLFGWIASSKGSLDTWTAELAGGTAFCLLLNAAIPVKYSSWIVGITEVPVAWANIAGRVDLVVNVELLVRHKAESQTNSSLKLLILDSQLISDKVRV